MPTAKPSCKSLLTEAHAAVIYPIRLNLEYHSVRGSKALVGGAGRAVSLSSEQIVFEAKAGLRPGLAIELSIEWPAKLYSARPLALVIRGRTISASPGRSAVRILSYEFRARAVQMARAAISPGP